MVLDIKTRQHVRHSSAVRSKKPVSQSTTSTSDFLDEMQGDVSLSDVQKAQDVHTISISHLEVIARKEEGPPRKIIDYGYTVLKHLEMLRNDLLLGQVSEASLHKLQELLCDVSLAAVDPDLRSVIEDIRIRAAVELAKWEKR